MSEHDELQVPPSPNGVRPAAQGGGKAAHDPDAPVDYRIGALDVVLAVLTLPLFLFVLMFATTGMSNMLERPSARLRLFVALLVVEVAAVATIAWLVVRG